MPQRVTTPTDLITVRHGTALTEGDTLRPLRRFTTRTKMVARVRQRSGAAALGGTTQGSRLNSVHKVAQDTTTETSVYTVQL